MTPPTKKRDNKHLNCNIVLKKNPESLFIIPAVLFSHNLVSNCNQCVSFITSDFTFWVNYLTKEVVSASIFCISLSQIRKGYERTWKTLYYYTTGVSHVGILPVWHLKCAK